MLKQSKYNFIYEDLGSDKTIFYNSRTGALSVVHNPQYEQFKNYVERGIEISDPVFLENLINCGYLIPENVDEGFLIKTKTLQGRYSTRTLSITIAPTMACNFRCVYCFEQGHYGNRLMDDDTVNAVIKFIKDKLDFVQTLRVSWFGGEPLLGMPIIKKISKELISACQEKNIKYFGSIVTNGYLLNKKMALELKECLVNRVQITLDGPKHIHDLRRPLANGNGTFDVIMKNLAEIDGMCEINLRINIDTDNLTAADSVMDTLKEYGISKSVYPYLALVIPFNGTYVEDKCLADEVYSKFNLQFMLKYNLPLRNIYPIPKSTCCGADYDYNWVIDDLGNLYKCRSNIGITDRAAGNVKYGQHYLQNTFWIDSFNSFDPLTDEQCKDCKVLPLCLGGCPYSRVSGRKICDQKKFTIHEYLLECTQVLLQSMPHS